MRLVCPNCGAQYEVPSGVIPADGRDVQCSNCGHTWFEPHPDAAPKPAAAPPPPPPPPTHDDPYEDAGDNDAGDDGALPDYDPPEAQARPRVDPAVADVLREEAAFEARARAAERDGGLETQPDLGLDDLGAEDAEARRLREAEERMARRRGGPSEVEAAVAATVAAEAARPRREQLPDIDDINATLRSSKEPRITDRQESPPHLQAAERDRASFRRGFFLMVLVAAALVALYIFAPRIAAMVPALGGALEAYVGAVDGLRGWLDGQVAAGLVWLDSMASESAQPEAPDAPQAPASN